MNNNNTLGIELQFDDEVTAQDNYNGPLDDMEDIEVSKNMELLRSRGEDLEGLKSFLDN